MPELCYTCALHGFMCGSGARWGPDDCGESPTTSVQSRRPAHGPSATEPIGGPSPPVLECTAVDDNVNCQIDPGVRSGAFKRCRAVDLLLGDSSWHGNLCIVKEPEMRS